MEIQSNAENSTLQIRVSPRLLWAERIFVSVSGIIYPVLIISSLRSDPEPFRVTVGMVSIAISIPYVLIVVFLSRNPPSKRAHYAALFLSAFGTVGLVLTLPLVALEALVISGGGIPGTRGMTAWTVCTDPSILLAILAGMMQPFLLMTAGRLYVNQGKSRTDVWLAVLPGLGLGLLLFIPLFTLMVMGLGI